MHQEVIDLLQELKHLPDFATETREGVISLTDRKSGQVFLVGTGAKSRITVNKVGSEEGSVFPSNASGLRLNSVRTYLRRLGLPVAPGKTGKPSLEVTSREQTTDPVAQPVEEPPSPPQDTPEEERMSEESEIVDLLLGDKEGVSKTLADAVVRRAASEGIRGFSKTVGTVRETYFDWEGDPLDVLREEWPELPDRGHEETARLHTGLSLYMSRTGWIKRIHVPDGKGGGRPVWRVRDGGNGSAYVAEYEARLLEESLQEQNNPAPEVVDDPPVVRDAEIIEEPEVAVEEASIPEVVEEHPEIHVDLEPAQQEQQADDNETPVDASESVDITPVESGGDVRVTYDKCDKCPYTDKPHSVVVHINRTIGDHPQTAYPCPKCPVVKVSINGYSKHMTDKHGAQGMMCTECLEFLPTRGALMIHGNEQHPEKEKAEKKPEAPEVGVMRRRARIEQPSFTTPEAPSRFPGSMMGYAPALDGIAGRPETAAEAAIRMITEHPTMQATIDDLRAKLDEAVTARRAAEGEIRKIKKVLGVS